MSTSSPPKQSWSQNIIQYFVPRSTFARMKAESEKWKMVCPECGHATNVWAQGGMRFGSASSKQTISGTCPSCGKKVNFELENENEAEEAQG